MTGQQERPHRRFSASQADSNAACPGRSNLLARVPKRTSVYAEEGTKAHIVLEAALNNGVRDAKVAHLDYSELCFEEDLNTVPNGFYSSIQTCLDYVYDLLDAFPDATMWIEAEVDPPLPAAPGEAAGYCDICIYIPSINTVYVIDYKHGAGIAKSPRSRQIIQYAAGFLFEANARIDVDTVDTVVLCVVQPRVFHPEGSIHEEHITPFEVYEYLDEINDIALAAMAPNAPLIPGEEQCRFCDANTVCPARETMALSGAVQSFSQIADVRESLLPAPSSMDLDRIGKILFHSAALKKWLSDVEAHAYELAMSGHYVPGRKIVEADARREYYGDADDLAEKIMQMSGADIDTVYPRQLLPLTYAQKLVVDAYKKTAPRGKKKQAAEQGAQAFAFLTLKTSSGKLTLVDETDPRPAVNKTERMFGAVQGLLPPPQ